MTTGNARYELNCALDYRLSSAIYGGCDSIEAAVAKWTESKWAEVGDDSGEQLLRQACFIVDRSEMRMVATVVFRWAELGESREPVAVVYDITNGTIREVRIEDSAR
ncbi:MAG: hypothetical protein ACYC6Y_10985 [Thermoguttaceae bacterium]